MTTPGPFDREGSVILSELGALYFSLVFKSNKAKLVFCVLSTQMHMLGYVHKHVQAHKWLFL